MASGDHLPLENQTVSSFKVGTYLTDVASSHSDIYELCVERNFGQKIHLLHWRQTLVKQPHQNIGSGDHLPLENQTVSSFKIGTYLTDVASSHSDIYETCVERNFGQKIRLLHWRQLFVKQPNQNIGAGDHLPLENQTVSAFKVGI